MQLSYTSDTDGISIGALPEPIMLWSIHGQTDGKYSTRIMHAKIPEL